MDDKFEVVDCTMAEDDESRAMITIGVADFSIIFLYFINLILIYNYYFNFNEN